MSMLLLPLPDYDDILRQNFAAGKMCQSPPSQPSSALSRLARLLRLAAAVVTHLGILPPPPCETWRHPWRRVKWMSGKQRIKINHSYLFMTDFQSCFVHNASFLIVQTKSGNWCKRCVRGICSLQRVSDASIELKC